MANAIVSKCSSQENGVKHSIGFFIAFLSISPYLLTGP
jgi:hypothetical protein